VGVGGAFAASPCLDLDFCGMRMGRLCGVSACCVLFGGMHERRMRVSGWAGLTVMVVLMEGVGWGVGGGIEAHGSRHGSEVGGRDTCWV